MWQAGIALAPNPIISLFAISLRAGSNQKNPACSYDGIMYGIIVQYRISILLLDILMLLFATRTVPSRYGGFF